MSVASPRLACTKPRFVAFLDISLFCAQSLARSGRAQNAKMSENVTFPVLVHEVGVHETGVPLGVPYGKALWCTLTYFGLLTCGSGGLNVVSRS